MHSHRQQQPSVQLHFHGDRSGHHPTDDLMPCGTFSYSSWIIKSCRGNIRHTNHKRQCCSYGPGLLSTQRLGLLSRKHDCYLHRVGRRWKQCCVFFRCFHWGHHTTNHSMFAGLGWQHGPRSSHRRGQLACTYCKRQFWVGFCFVLRIRLHFPGRLDVGLVYSN